MYYNHPEEHENVVLQEEIWTKVILNAKRKNLLNFFFKFVLILKNQRFGKNKITTNSIRFNAKYTQAT